jgi:anti-anti-sigma factor
VLGITSRIVSDVVVFDLSGRFSFMEFGLHEQTKELLNAGRRDFVLNLAEVSYIDSFAIGQMFTIWTSIRAKEGRVVLLQPVQKVQEVLRVSKLDAIFPVFTDEVQAIANARLPSSADTSGASTP